MKYFFLNVFAVFGMFMIHLISLSQNSEASISLKVGDKAPDIKIEKWIKGKPVSRFQKGLIYVVEFGGVGCSPCRGAIPHLSELSNLYVGKAVLISVYTDYSVTAVEKFIKKMGDKITYIVAADGPKKQMQSTWSKAAGRNGIPDAFIVDQRGLIAWIGHPIDINNDMLNQLIAGTFDPQAAIEKQDASTKINEQILSLKKSGDFSTILSLVEEQLKENPANPYLPIEKFDLLFLIDERKAYSYGWEMLNGKLRDVESSLWYMARHLFGAHEKKQIENPDWNLVISLTERAFSLCQSQLTSAHILLTQAEAYQMKNDYVNAFKIAKKALSIVDNIPKRELEYDAKTYFNEVVTKYKNLAAGGKK